MHLRVLSALVLATVAALALASLESGQNVASADCGTRKIFIDYVRVFEVDEVRGQPGPDTGPNLLTFGRGNMEQDTDGNGVPNNWTQDNNGGVARVGTKFYQGTHSMRLTACDPLGVSTKTMPRFRIPPTADIRIRLQLWPTARAQAADGCLVIEEIIQDWGGTFTVTKRQKFPLDDFTAGAWNPVVRLSPGGAVWMDLRMKLELDCHGPFGGPGQ
jgi:hypothetical protein